MNTIPEAEAFTLGDQPTPLQRAQDAVIQSIIDERRQKGVVDGRDWTGCLVAPQSLPQRPETPPTCRLFRLACPKATVAEEELFAKQARVFATGGWWLLFGEELMAAEQAEAVEYAKTQPERDAAKARVLEAFRQKTAAEIVEIQARKNLKRGEAVKKNPCPCSRLYSCVGDKSTGGAKPTTRHVSSECWSHERTDPLTGAIIAKHVCPWLHPGEPGWHAEWMTDRFWKPAAEAAAPTRSWEPENRFTSVKPRQTGWDGRRR